MRAINLHHNASLKSEGRIAFPVVTDKSPP